MPFHCEVIMKNKKTTEEKRAEKSRLKNAPLEHKRKAALEALCSALFAGLGLILQKSFARGIIYALVEVGAILLFVFWGLDAIKGMISLGEVPMQDHSLILMVYGILAFIIFIAFIIFWISNIRETYEDGINLRSGTYIRRTGKEAFSYWMHEHTHVLFLAPGIAAIACVIVIPLVFSICIGFTDYDAGHQPPAHILNWVGFKNFKDLLFLGQYAETFFKILGWTVVWAIGSTLIPYTLGILLGVLLNNERLKGRKIYKLIYILPWAIPGYITLLVLQTMFDTGSGMINQIIVELGGENIRWLTSVGPARAALLIVATWTGFSYPMMLSESIIKNINRDIYEAAILDGAGKVRTFFSITLPILLYSISPILIMSFAGAFNSFNTIYLITGGGPLNLDYQSAGSTDILITWLFKLTITNNKYNYGSAISIILFILIATFSIINLRKTKTFSEEGMMS